MLHLAVEGHEEELPVLADRKPEGSAHLILQVDVGSNSQSIVGGEALAAVEVMNAAVDFVGP